MDNSLPEEIREMGVILWKQGTDANDEAKKSEGIRLLMQAYRKGDIEAAAWIGFLLYRNILSLKGGDSKEKAVEILYSAASRGSMMARTILNQLCFERYKEALKDRPRDRADGGPLLGFDGKRIIIKRTGLFTPIDAVLNMVDGINRLTLSANILFFSEELNNPTAFENAVISGIKEWEGEYRVFGGQLLQVAINLTTDNRIADNVYVLPITNENEKVMREVSSFIHGGKRNKRIVDLVDNNRSMTMMGLRKWSTRSRKIICIASQDKCFNDLDEIKHVAKHEFGHALGLGDLYYCSSDHLEGVEKGSFAELDGYYIRDKIYNLVMSDHHGPISNNDIEMVVLAFSEDKAQLYQKDKRFKLEISGALGKGD